MNARDYSPEQLHAWAPAPPNADTWIQRRLPTRTTFVADDNGTLAGFGEIEPNGHIDCFYCHHAYQGRGVGSALLARIEQHARDVGLARLFVEASITARPFFQARGYTVIRQQSVERHGIQLTNFVMEKRLSQISHL